MAASGTAEERPAVVGGRLDAALLSAAIGGISCPRGSDAVRKVALSAKDMTELLRAAYVRACADKNVDVAPGEEGLARRLRKVASWLTDPVCRPFLLLHGGYGNGKTTMTRAVGGALAGLRSLPGNVREEDRAAAEAIRRSVPVFCFVTATELCNMAENEVDKFEEVKDFDMLAVDDVGCEPTVIKRYGTESSPFVEVIYHRYERMLPTVITSNLDLKGLREKYGPRVGDRLNEICNHLHFTNGSYRTGDGTDISDAE